jgi:elongator complex protein 1
MLPLSSLPVFCPILQQVAIKVGPAIVPLLFGLSAGSKLYATTPSHAIAPLLSSAVVSFAVAGSFLIYTTSAHESIYIPLSALEEVLETPDLDIREGGAEGALLGLSKSAERRRIERGSRIVTAVPSAMSLVLQMPRGNLETINPRPLVLEVVKSDIDQ